MQTIEIETNALTFSYGKQQILSNINATIPKNQITALIGPSGSGKSTLLRCFNRLYELYGTHRITGKIKIDGRNILNPDLDVVSLRREVGMVLQKPTPFPMSIHANLTFALRTHRILPSLEEDAYIEQQLKAVSLWDEVKDKLHASANELSGGQQQRLCIARTLCTEPNILLLDEPTSSLDPNSTHAIEELILKLRQRYTIVMVTHHLGQAKRLSDKVIFLKKGEIVEQLPTHDFFDSTNPTTQEYLKYA
jgi:phosphate transport system ATP-binding protein